MVNPRQRRKSKSATHKKTRPARHAQRNLRKMKPIRGPQVLQDAWDKKKTVRQNYDALGLARDLKPTEKGGTEKALSFSLVKNSSNSESSSKTTKKLGKIIRDEQGEILEVQLPEENLDNSTEDDVIENPRISLNETLPAGKPEVVEALERLAQTSRPVRRYASDAETAALKRLLAKHGHDYDAMAKDLRLNPWQRTSGQLQRACKKADLV